MESTVSGFGVTGTAVHVNFLLQFVEGPSGDVIKHVSNARDGCVVGVARAADGR